MELKDYKAPQVKVVGVNVQNVLCQSNGNTENFVIGNRYDDENDWE